MTWVTEELRKQLESWVLVVGAGGIGCELLKNLALTGFKNIVVIDLDTIDISNLNRQFLFRKEHVGKSKAEVAAAAVKTMRHDVNIEYYHDSIMNEKYDVSFFQRFAVVMSALDNRSARSHVNRLCLAAKVPLIESGSAGYLGQVGVILKGKTECYDCVPKQEGKSYPGCTIRNTPSEPIHCVLWAKSLFNQLFGEADPDDDVSPDATDEEAKSKNGENGTSDEAKKDNGEVAANGDSNSSSAADEPKHTSTRQLAEMHDYNPQKLFDKLFFGDINYLLSMANLWKQRRQPAPLTWETAVETETGSSSKPQTANEVWSLAKWAEVYEESVAQLANRFKEVSKNNGILTWDKDDEHAMIFVAACANIRAHIFHIPIKSLFDIKAMAGNIIPAIATTNACVAGMLVVEALKVVRQQMDKIRWVFVARKPNPRGKILVDGPPEPPRANCYVCSDKREVYVAVNVDEMLLKTFEAKVLKKALCMIAPDATDVLSSNIIISSEEGETDAIMDHTLAKVGMRHGSQLDCDDFKQQLDLKVVVFHDAELKADDYKLVSDSKGADEGNGNADEHMDAENGTAAANGEASSKQAEGTNDADELKRKRKSELDDESGVAKRSRIDVE